MRGSGVLFPIFSLPSAYGIGCFSQEAYDFIDFLKKAGQTYWEILPLGPTGFGDSPYQPVSSFAGNPYFISPDGLIEEGLLTKEEAEAYSFGDDIHKIDYGALYNYRYPMLKQAFARFKPDADYRKFVNKEAYWLKDYARFMTLKNLEEGKSWQDWPAAYKKRTPAAMKKIETEYKEQIDFYSFLQYMFQKQWTKLRAYAKENGIRIIGDLPFYMGLDSADVWAHPESFKMNGFSDYYQIPADAESAEEGKWMAGPRMKFFTELQDTLGDVPMIAEDLGTITKTNAKLLKEPGLPGMMILQYAFTGWNEDSFYLPYKHIRNCVVYTGNHDNPTAAEWIETINDHDRDYVRRYIHSENTNTGGFVWDFIREAYRSVADTIIVPLQDYLVKGEEARINQPGTSQGNWQWRLEPNFLSDELADSMYQLSKLYGRLPAVDE
ncbi:4-alpha-glucanotransferase [Catenisphaera adipataccumulans]|uniref:4-alpha-glucanotransferase n=1 Tax=Catenisphaera adipataccumulans TaxID=700500 RepID=A0A7W8FUZ5_9FIRM|nr:4-alpha-glucanotransferase [Catenisphaera adipataccumulans]MBB5183084.1 4-alpha-glucanotransferase [Catenisphaera adipataccumulans]